MVTPVTITPPSPFTFTDSVLPVFNLISDAVPPLALTVSVISSEPLASTSRSPGVAIICLLSPNLSDTLSFKKSTSHVLLVISMLGIITP